MIQGQYGPQFTAAERRRLLRFIAANGFNAYVHAPKGDPYQRTLWRDPYPPDQQAELDYEVQLATRLGVDWIPNVSPGAPAFSSPGDALPAGSSPSAPICFSRDADLEALLAKLEPFLRAGSGAVMVSFDDIHPQFSCDADRDAYGEGRRAYGLASADLLDRLDSSLRARDPSIRLLTVGADYQGTGDSDYLQGLRAALAPGIEVMWTGASTESRPFAPADADAYAGLVGRAPVVWENWTANDGITEPGSSPSRVFLGPYSRPASIVGHVHGFFFNPANQADLNFLPLATAGRWMRDPSRYRPRRAFLQETRRLAGSRARWLRAFAETSYTTTLRAGVEAPTVSRLIRHFLAASGSKGGGQRLATHLRRQLQLDLGAGGHLRRVGRLRYFVREARPFLRSAMLNARAALLATDLLQARSVARRGRLRRRLRGAIGRARAWPGETFGTRTGVYGLAGNVIDRYVARVVVRNHRWLLWRRSHPRRDRHHLHH